MKGRILYGINNIYTVLVDGRTIECRIKGKVLKFDKSVYNPLAPGDFVEIEKYDISSGSGTIIERLTRKNEIVRWNNKKLSEQTFASNIDQLLCVSSSDSPGFRPGFVDRILVSAEKSRIPVIMVLNKIDIGISDAIKKNLSNYKHIGYRNFLCSALTGSGVKKLKKMMESKVSVLIGQSGVGKSSLLNRLFPGIDLKTGEISRKFNRGRHTTNYSRMICCDNNTSIIDTPGIREFEVGGISSGELDLYFPEMMRHKKKCTYTSCLHLDEPECGIKKAVKAGRIFNYRYESYKKILYGIIKREKERFGKYNTYS